MRSKCRTLPNAVNSLTDLPDWNFDGSSCELANTENSEVIMKPVAYYPDPFRGGDNIMVLTDTYKWKDKTYSELIPTPTNFRYHAKKIFEACPEEKPWFGLEQEYTMLLNEEKKIRPLGWPEKGAPHRE